MKSSIMGKAEGTLHQVKDNLDEVTAKVADQEPKGTGESEIQACSWKAPSEVKMLGMRRSEEGKVGWVLLWALGIPIPILVALYLLRGCT
jgi:RNA-splicing ligase RtcB